ncbi:hypothetical protein GCM10017044_19670 [Kordiimonas sediminis]|uniref:Uncharacterized protein n=1 Tax=Kordiimonas sediminis TaxID=1735581 RepID=A0A919AT71_9PROT|nr:hypothetical protein [Kordiimonas sediminis]GHF24969.1 hypothetical protein GCM10017044_19670 [Kordiimonas sediminis]
MASITPKMGGNAITLLKLWQAHGGDLSMLSFADALDGRYAEMYEVLFFIRFEGDVILSSILGQDLIRREKDKSLGLSAQYLDLFPETEQEKVHALYTAARSHGWGIAGTVERLPAMGSALIRRSFVSLPVSSEDGVSMFVNVDDDPYVRSDHIREENLLPQLMQGQTRMLEYEYFDPRTCTP